MQMFTSTRDEHRTRHYCPDCADTNIEVRTELAKAYEIGELKIINDFQEIASQVCETCLRPIVSVPAYQGAYRIEVQITFSVTVELQARSSTDAEQQLNTTVKEANFDSIMEEIETTLEGNLDDPEKVSVDNCQYLVEPGRRIPPQVFVSPTQERMGFRF